MSANDVRVALVPTAPLIDSVTLPPPELASQRMISNPSVSASYTPSPSTSRDGDAVAVATRNATDAAAEEY